MTGKRCAPEILPTRCASPGSGAWPGSTTAPESVRCEGHSRPSSSPLVSLASFRQCAPADLMPSHAGVRAQAMTPEGGLVDDFHIIRRDHQVHVLNAPSPAATASLEIAKHIVAGIP